MLKTVYFVGWNERVATKATVMAANEAQLCVSPDGSTTLYLKDKKECFDDAELALRAKAAEAFEDARKCMERAQAILAAADEERKKKPA